MKISKICTLFSFTGFTNSQKTKTNESLFNFYISNRSLGVVASQKTSKENAKFMEKTANIQQFWCNFTWFSQNCEGRCYANC